MAGHAVKERSEELSLEELRVEQKILREKTERKRLEAFWWAAVLIWTGMVFFADYLGILPGFREAGAWSWIFLGAGVFGLIGAMVRVSSERLLNPTGWDYFWSALFLIIGATGFFGGGIAFPIVLLVIGIAILGNALYRQR